MRRWQKRAASILTISPDSQLFTLDEVAAAIRGAMVGQSSRSYIESRIAAGITAAVWHRRMKEMEMLKAQNLMLKSQVKKIR